MTGQISDNALTEFGVSQGSVLGLLLSLIYINDLNQAIKFSRVHHFANNINLLLVDSSFKKDKQHINHNLGLPTPWLRANRTSLNTSKTEILLLFHRQYIPQTTQVKCLGLTMNEHLHWDLYFSQLKKKLNCGIGLLAKINILLQSTY